MRSIRDDYCSAKASFGCAPSYLNRGCAITAAAYILGRVCNCQWAARAPCHDISRNLASCEAIAPACCRKWTKHGGGNRSGAIRNHWISANYDVANRIVMIEMRS